MWCCNHQYQLKVIDISSLYSCIHMVKFVHRLREERPFAGTEELTEQLLRDEERVRELLATEE